MCMACEEAEMLYRWRILETIAKGEMPPGLTEDDLRAMEMPLPGEVELIEEPDGRVVIRKIAKAAAKRAAAKANAFVCDTPDSE